MMTTTTILNSRQIQDKIRRMAFQIYESNIAEKEIILAGIAQGGFKLAEKLKSTLEEISDLQVHLCKVTMDKKKPIGTVSTDFKEIDYRDKSVILVDDVLNSGSTLIYAVCHFLRVPLKQFKTAVLVNRNHKKYPVKADFKGISLSTSINENVVVRLVDPMAVSLE